MSTEDAGSYGNWARYLDGRIAYLRGAERGDAPPGPLRAGGAFVPGTRYEFDVWGIGREEKQPPAPPPDPKLWRLPFEDLLVGAYTYRIPISFRLRSTAAGGLSLALGTWTADPGGDDVCRDRCEVLRALLGTLYPVAATSAPRPPLPAAGPVGVAGGLVTGHPTAKPPVAGDNVLPVDRIARALAGRAWNVLVLASPEPESTPQRMREALVAELGRAHDMQRSAGHELPVVALLEQVTEPTLRTLLDATATGSWRTAVYLEADGATYPVLASVWRSVYSGERSSPEAIRVLDLPPGLAGDLAGAGAVPRDAEPSDPGRYRHPFTFQTLLSSAQLSAYVHLPGVDASGFWVDVVPRFDASVNRRRVRGPAGDRFGARPPQRRAPRLLDRPAPAVVHGVGARAVAARLHRRRDGLGQDDDVSEPAPRPGHPWGAVPGRRAGEARVPHPRPARPG